VSALGALSALSTVSAVTERFELSEHVECRDRGESAEGAQEVR
jgi:hypothetical protein